ALLNRADVVVLCLPDEAAREAVSLIDNSTTKVLDASTAHRVAPDWVYGLPELTASQRTEIAGAGRVSNPGCYPTGFILSVRPLVDAGLLSAHAPMSVHAMSGYSGGGRNMIERYEANAAAGGSPRPPQSYGLGLDHKHLPEMTRFAGLDAPPIFSPAVGDYYKGMLVHVPLDQRNLSAGVGAAEIHHALQTRYATERCIRVLPLGAPLALDGGFLDPTAANGTNRVDLMVFGNDRQAIVVTRFDNLGKGASGAAVANLNLMLGLPELAGLTV
ncbi:MAG: N-acetyl-gamma-glutamyl-phosphate reductase, partial [Gammaproteobacteria bacterium]|nr:N-acetyl-gamma-glutamyl-phosphate reductase [Gammaproteobacteria bacterium]